MCRPKRFLQATRWRENLSSGEKRAVVAKTRGEGGGERGVGGNLDKIGK